MAKRILFIGGPGNISENAINLLLENAENRIAVFTLPESSCRGLSDKVIFYWGNRDNTKKLSQTINDFKPDVIADFVCFLPEQAKSIAEIAKDKVQQFIFVSTCDVYGYPLSCLPMRETDIWVKTNSSYAENKRKCEEVFKSYSNAGGIPLTIVRPSYSFGNEFVISFFSRDGGRELIPRLKAGKPVFVPGDGTTLMHPGSAYNTGRMIGNIIGSDKTIGKNYTCGHESFTSHDKYIGLFAKTLGVEPNLVHIPYDLLIKTGRKEVDNSILEDVTRHNIAFSIDAFKADFPVFKWEKSLEDAAAEYIKFSEDRRMFASPAEEIFEDKLIAAWFKATKDFNALIQ